MRRIGLSIATIALVVTGLLAVPRAAEPVAAANGYQASLGRAIRALVVRRETPAGYAASKFPHWVDANDDCQDARAEVLIAESTRPVTLNGCAVLTGRWVSYFDGIVRLRASGVAVDHLVPLKEAWDSGARRWDLSTRRRFANDLGDVRSLVAVTDQVNRLKGNRDPAQWLPARQRCRYIKQWVAVKHRWRLSVDTAERNAVLRVKNNLGCSGTVKVKRANIVLRRGPIVATDCGLGLARRPQAIKLDCAEWARISGLRWSSWMPQFAAGKGWYSEGCGSPCGGEPLDPVKVAVRLSRPERYQCGDLEPEPAYSLLEHRPWNEPNADWTGVDVTAVC